MARLKAVADLGTHVLAQSAAINLIARLAAIIDARRRELRERRDLLVRLLHATLPTWKFETPAGGQTLWVRMPGCGSRRFAQVALRHGVALLEGASLAAGQAGTEHLRLPFKAPPETLAGAVRRIEAAWHDYQKAAQGRPVIAAGRIA